MQVLYVLMWLIPNITAETTKSIEEMAEKYENDKNSVIATSEEGLDRLYTIIQFIRVRLIH